MKDLNSNGIGAAVYYSTPVHKTPYYGKKLNLPVTDWAARSVLSLPVQPMVTEDNLRLMARIIRSALS
jgi:dTDP-4-amino-4,6-dideoxygalactose transaminase